MILVLAAAVLTGCSPADPAPPSASKAGTAPPALESPTLPEPAVSMAADPPPPFTYWAPAGSVIRGHPHQPGVWFAELPGGERRTYFGDDCGASRHQGLVGQPVEAASGLSAEGGVRVYIQGDPIHSDLRPNRLNVAQDRASGRILEIACY